MDSTSRKVAVSAATAQQLQEIIAKLDDLEIQNGRLAAENALLRRQLMLARDNAGLKVANILTEILAWFDDGKLGNIVESLRDGQMTGGAWRVQRGIMTTQGGDGNTQTSGDGMMTLNTQDLAHGGSSGFVNTDASFASTLNSQDLMGTSRDSGQRHGLDRSGMDTRTPAPLRLGDLEASVRQTPHVPRAISIDSGNQSINMSQNTSTPQPAPSQGNDTMRSSKRTPVVYAKTVKDKSTGNASNQKADTNSFCTELSDSDVDDQEWMAASAASKKRFSSVGDALKPHGYVWERGQDQSGRGKKVDNFTQCMTGDGGVRQAPIANGFGDPVAQSTPITTRQGPGVSGRYGSTNTETKNIPDLIVSDSIHFTPVQDVSTASTSIGYGSQATPSPTSPILRPKSPTPRSKSPSPDYEGSFSLPGTDMSEPRPKSPRRNTKSQRRRPMSPRQRSKSPRQRSKSPRERSKSPRDRSRSPRNRSKSPRDVSKSLGNSSKSPKNISKSLGNRLTTPNDRSKSPRNRSKSPRDGSKSPRDRSKSPRNRSKSPRSRSKSPRSGAKSPRSGSKSPRNISKSPRNRSKSPRDRSKSPRDRPKSPRNESKSSRRVEGSTKTSSKARPKSPKLRSREVEAASIAESNFLSPERARYQSIGTNTLSISANEMGDDDMSQVSRAKTGQVDPSVIPICKQTFENREPDAKRMTGMPKKTPPGSKSPSRSPAPSERSYGGRPRTFSTAKKELGIIETALTQSSYPQQEPLSPRSPGMLNSSPRSPREPIPGNNTGVSTSQPSQPTPAEFNNFWNSVEPDRTQQFESFVATTRLIGELAFQLDRRILNYVFNSVRHTGNKTRFYGYLVKNIPDMIDKQTMGRDGEMHDAALATLLNYRYKYVLYCLEPMGYDITVHADFCIDMVNRYGLLPVRTDNSFLTSLHPSEGEKLRELLRQVAPVSELRDVLVLLNCLIALAKDDGKPLFVW